MYNYNIFSNIDYINVIYKFANEGNYMETRRRNAKKFVRPISESCH